MFLFCFFDLEFLLFFFYRGSAGLMVWRCFFQECLAGQQRHPVCHQGGELRKLCNDVCVLLSTCATDYRSRFLKNQRPSRVMPMFSFAFRKNLKGPGLTWTQSSSSSFASCWLLASPEYSLLRLDMYSWLLHPWWPGLSAICG